MMWNDDSWDFVGLFRCSPVLCSLWSRVPCCCVWCSNVLTSSSETVKPCPNHYNSGIQLWGILYKYSIPQSSFTHIMWGVDT